MCLIPCTKCGSRMFSLAVHVGIRVPDARADRRGAELSADHVHRPGGRHRREDDRRRVVDLLGGLRDNVHDRGVKRRLPGLFEAEGPHREVPKCSSHTDDDVDRTVDAVAAVLRSAGWRG